jgi:hypothetical protein
MKNDTPEKNLLDFPSNAAEPTNLKDTQPTTGSVYNSSNYMLPDISKPSSNPSPPVQPVSGSGGNEYLVLRMMQETGQDRDICYYLLESVNFDFDQAMEIMMQNLQVK